MGRPRKTQVTKPRTKVETLESGLNSVVKAYKHTFEALTKISKSDEPANVLRQMAKTAIDEARDLS